MKRILFFCFVFSLITTTYAQEKVPTQSFQEESLFYAGKIWGFVKYYHPEARLGKFDIDSSLVVLLDKVSETKTTKDRNKVFSEWVANFGEIADFEKLVIKDSSQYKLFYDYSWLENQAFDKKLSKQLIDIKNAKRTDSCYYADVSVIHIPNFRNEKSILPDFTKSFQQLLPLFRYWNVIEYYFPYKYFTDKKWDDVLKKYISIFPKIDNGYRLHQATQWLIAEIDDGHSSFKNNYMYYPYKYYYSPIKLIYSKDRFIVNGLLPYHKTTGDVRDYGLEIGDEIVSVNGKDPREILSDEFSNYAGLSNMDIFYERFKALLFHSDTTFMEVIYKRDGAVFNGRTILNRPQYQETPQKEKKKFSITKDSIAYLNVSEIVPDEIYEILHKVSKTKGLILDMRGYPDYHLCSIIASFINPFNLVFVKLTGVNKKNPGIFKYFIDSNNYSGYSRMLFYKEKVVIIVNSSTMSRSEFCTMHFQIAPLATTIGSQSAGADGDIAYIPLQKGIEAVFSTLGIYYPDGGETQRVGVRIDEQVYPTPKGIKEGRDELVERAINIIRFEPKKVSDYHLREYQKSIRVE